MPFDFTRRDDDPGLLSRRLLSLSVEEVPRRRNPWRYADAAIGWTVIGLLVWLALISF